MSACVDVTGFVSCRQVSFLCQPTALHVGFIVVLDCSDSALLSSNLVLERAHVLFISCIGKKAFLPGLKLHSRGGLGCNLLLVCVFLWKYLCGNNCHMP
jgi:hypothetical protein